MSNSSPFSQEIRQTIGLLAHRAFHEQGHYLKSAGLSMAQFGILMQLHSRQQCGISDIGNRMEISNAAASQLVEKLVQNEFVERTEDPQDRRAKQLKLTDKGRALIETSLQARSRWMDDLIAVLTPEESAIVSQGFSILAEAAKRIDSPLKK
jgi:MarR family transcriptional regulator, organic hydroperoxide resistance regulator